MRTLLWPTLLLFIGCAGAATPAVRQPTEPTGTAPAEAPHCDAAQLAISREADARAAPQSIAAHLAKNFADGRVSWLMKDTSYEAYIVTPKAQHWGRCNDRGCFLFAAPAAVIHAAVDASMHGGHHDAAALGKALGLPAANLDGPLRMMTLDHTTSGACTRLPVESDPGAYACKTPDDTDCFEFGGYTSGGVPELMVIDAAVDETQIEQVP
ncbi:MAG TPA: hypothetical protein VHE35_00870 [Kofleriaceae bacterium]|nr:hypothetical protein [Kofleriaceae bacterium]